MTPEEFDGQWSRLASEWKTAYGKAKQHELWKIFRHQPVERFDYAITRAMKKCRYAPTLAELEDFAIDYHEMKINQQRRQNSQDAKEFFTYSPEESTHVMSIIKARIRGEVSDEDYESFKQDLKRVAYGEIG